MNSLNLIIEHSLSSEFKEIRNRQNLNNQTNSLNQLQLLKTLYEIHNKCIGVLTDTEKRALNEHVQLLQSKIQLNEQPILDTIKIPGVIPNPGQDTINKLLAQNKGYINSMAGVNGVIKKSNAVKQKFLSSGYNFTQGTAQSEIQNLIKKGTIKRWKNATADNFFLNIIKQDPNYNSAGKKPLDAGYVYDMSNPDKQSYDYEILVTDSKGKSMAFARFGPDGTVQLMPDLQSTAESAITYKVEGGKVKIYSTQETKIPIATGTPNDYSISFTFNPQLQFVNYDPYKGAGLWHALFLDLQGFKRAGENKFKSQAEYDDSMDANIDKLQTVGDWAGLIPGFGDIIDVVNGLVYWYRGKRWEALLSWIAVIPVIGSAIKLGFKGAISSFKVGTKTGVEAIEALIKGGFKGSKEAFVNWIAKNKQARQAAISFAGKGKAWIKGLIVKLKDIAKNLRGKTLVGWVGRTIDYLVERFAKPLEEYISKFSKNVDDAVQSLDELQDLATVGKKAEAKVAGYVGKKGVRAVLKGLSAELPKNAEMIYRMLYKMLGKKWFDAFHRSMIESFIRYIKQTPKGVEKFITVLCTTREGAGIVLESMDTFMKPAMNTMIDYFMTRPGRKILERYVPEFNLTLLSKNMSKREIELLYSQIYLAVRKLVGTAEFPKMLNELVLGPMSKNTDRLAAFVDDAIISCIQKGNVTFQLFAMSFWNKMRAMLPGRIAKFYDALGVGYAKYDFKGGRIADLSGTVGKWVDSVFKVMPSWLAQLLALPIKLIIGILDAAMNIKRIDVWFNEIEGILEELGINADDINEKQSIVAAAIQYGLSSAPFKFIKDVINWLDPIIDPSQYGLVSSPTDYEFVKQQKFKTSTEK